MMPPIITKAPSSSTTGTGSPAAVLTSFHSTPDLSSRSASLPTEPQECLMTTTLFILGHFNGGPRANLNGSCG